MTALVIGSMTPDFEYFIHFKQLSVHSHTWPGIFYYDLPLGMLLIYLFNHYVREHFINNLPKPLYSRFIKFKYAEGNVKVDKPWYIVVLSLLIGITTHLIWDKVTHHSVNLFDEGQEFYSEIWNLNSVVGTALLAYAVIRMPHRSSVVQRVETGYWKSIAKLTALTLLLVAIISRLVFDAAVNERSAGTSLISSFLIALLFQSFRLHYKNTKSLK